MNYLFLADGSLMKDRVIIHPIKFHPTPGSIQYQNYVKCTPSVTPMVLKPYLHAMTAAAYRCTQSGTLDLKPFECKKLLTSVTVEIPNQTLKIDNLVYNFCRYPKPGMRYKIIFHLDNNGILSYSLI